MRHLVNGTYGMFRPINESDDCIEVRDNRGCAFNRVGAICRPIGLYREEKQIVQFFQAFLCSGNCQQ
jgi:hypothetical protein